MRYWKLKALWTWSVLYYVDVCMGQVIPNTGNWELNVILTNMRLSGEKHHKNQWRMESYIM